MRAILACVLLLSAASAGCEGSIDDEGVGGEGGSGASAGTNSGPATSTGSQATTGAQSTTSTTAATGTSTTTGQTGTTGTGMDPYAAARQACIAKINELRATKGLPAYGQWTSGETCADQQATSDEQSGTAHGAFGMCGESGQNECLGAGVAGIESCLESMWAEKDQPGCAGCDACNGGYDPNCPNCDFYGDQTGDVCGHYVNMSALYFSEAACGFSSLGGWDVINFH
ncbi:MAG: hypothetical protein JNL21_10010 [Myxococcales bacterium]|nr:hypothetical protein [Myxococcales bacterium]